MESRAWSLFLLLLLLTGAAAGVLVIEERRAREVPSFAESFQGLVGGLGFGPALDLSDGTSDFDPRLGGSWSRDHGPIAGGSRFNPRQVGFVFLYRPVKKEIH